MADSVARQQRANERRQRIVIEAQKLAEAEGWTAVTTRRLADAIGYTQPVLYGHFPGGKSEIMRDVALEGFAELAQQCGASIGRKSGRRAVEAVARTYLEFAAGHSALYEVMFDLPIAARFAAEDNEPELRVGFDVLARALGDGAGGTATEIFWGALHGVSQLERAGRMQPEDRSRRIAELGSRFMAPLPVDGEPDRRVGRQVRPGAGGQPGPRSAVDVAQRSALLGGDDDLWQPGPTSGGRAGCRPGPARSELADDRASRA